MLTLTKLQKEMFKTAGNDEQLRRDVTQFFLINLQKGADAAAQFLQTKPQVNEIFSQIARKATGR